MSISLRNIQSTLQMFWLDSAVCEDYFCGDADSQAGCVSAAFRRNCDRQGVELYGQLMRFGWHDVMSSIYPLCEDLLGDEWQNTVDHYLKMYPPGHFNLNRLAQHFSCYLASHGDELLRRFPYIAELADYEWMELEVLEHPAVVFRKSDAPLSTAEEFALWSPIVNPTLCTRRYQYPLLEIAESVARGEPASIVLSHAKQAYVAAFRPSQSNDCQIIELSKPAFTVLEKVVAKSCTYAQLARQAICLCKVLSSQDAVLEFIDLIEKLHDMDIFVGAVLHEQQ